MSGATGGEAAPRGRAPQPQPTPAAPAPADSVVAPTGTVDQFAARDSGGTAGVTDVGGQQVFTSSKPKADPAGKAAGGREAQQAAPSEGAAVSDAWGGFRSGATASDGGTPAAALGAEGSGSTLGLAILGLGLVGMLGALALAVPRRRRAKANR